MLFLTKSRRDGGSYASIIKGLFYGIVLDSTKNKEGYFNYLNHVNQDGYEFLLITMCRVFNLLIKLLDHCHFNLSLNAYLNCLWIFDKISHLSSPGLVEFFKLLLRTVYPGVTSKIEFYSNLLEVIKAKINFIISSRFFIASLTFIKVLRQVITKLNQFSEHHFREEEIYKKIIDNEVFILTKIWSNKKEEVLSVGKELIRLLIPISKTQRIEITAIIEEIAKADYLNLIACSSQKQGFNPFVQICIPPMLEKMLFFIVTEAKRMNLNKYMLWMMKKFNISSEVKIFINEGEDESIMPDIVRYVITCIQTQNISPDIPQRWILLGW